MSSRSWSWSPPRPRRSPTASPPGSSATPSPRTAQIVEDTFDWYAQDADGNVWYLGEDTAEFEDGEITLAAGSFEAGVDGALPGIMHAGRPAPRACGTGRSTTRARPRTTARCSAPTRWSRCRPAATADALLTKDTITIEPDVQEYKLYAAGRRPGAGRSGVSGGSGREELVRVDQAPAGRRHRPARPAEPVTAGTRRRSVEPGSVRVLIVEDEAKLADLLRRGLTAHGLAVDRGRHRRGRALMAAGDGVRGDRAGP